jgi:hypothetical protein
MTLRVNDRNGSWLCENSAEATSLKKIPAFSRPQVDQKAENRKR